MQKGGKALKYARFAAHLFARGADKKGKGKRSFIEIFSKVCYNLRDRYNGVGNDSSFDKIIR